MGFVLVTAGLLMIVTGAKGTYAQFGQQVASDFTGPGNFTYWIVSLGAVGALGYIESMRVFSRLFMALILIAMLLSNRGFFQKLTDALKSGPVAPKAVPSQASGASNPAAAATAQVQGLFGQSPDSAGQSKFNGWMNWFFGTGTKTTP